MPSKIYTKGTTVVDEVLAGAERYDIKEDAGTAFKSNMQVVLATVQTVPGSLITAARVNNIETGIDALDTILAARTMEGVAELDFGTTPCFQKTFTVTDATVTAAKKIMIVESAAIATGKLADENEFDNLFLKAVAGTGNFTVYARAFPGPVHGKFKANYLIIT
jgi:hypothetical protein